jgi:hypothetical protein
VSTPPDTGRGRAIAPRGAVKPWYFMSKNFSSGLKWPYFSSTRHCSKCPKSWSRAPFNRN